MITKVGWTVLYISVFGKKSSVDTISLQYLQNYQTKIYSL